jgi:uncharacterized protein YjbI with pentapeptide repeats
MKFSRPQTFLPAILLSGLALTSSLSAVHDPASVSNFKQTNQCRGCDLTGAELMGMQAPGAQLQNANLSDASFYGGSLRGADLTGAILDRTNLEMVDLTGAIGAILGPAQTDNRTTCPDGSAGPCS